MHYSKIPSYLSSSVMTPIWSSLSHHPPIPVNKSTDSLGGEHKPEQDKHAKEIERLTRLAYDDNVQIKYQQVATLTSGASFGELALIKNKPRWVCGLYLQSCHNPVSGWLWVRNCRSLWLQASAWEDRTSQDEQDYRLPRLSALLHQLDSSCRCQTALFLH